MPDIQYKLSDKLKNFANTAIDVSDGLITDLDKMINTQKISYKLILKDIPISNNLKKIINLKKLKKINLISNGDDYQILFTASKDKRRIIKNIALKNRIKITNIGKIQNLVKKSSIVDEKNMKTMPKNKGYIHEFY